VHANAQTVVSGFQAFAEGDMAIMQGLLADDATWHVAGRNKWSGDYTGPQPIVRYMSGVAAEANLVNQPHAILAADDHVVVLVATSASRNVKSLDGNTVYVFHVNDAKTTETWVNPGDQYAQDEYWAD